MKLQTCFFAILICMSFSALSQTEIKVTDPGVSVNDNGHNTPDPSAVLDVQSNNKGVVFPRLTTEQRDGIENPIPGLLVFNTDNCIYEYFNGSSWQVIGVIPVQEVPLDPTNLTASISGTNAITLNWTDNSNNESGFEIWYKTSSTSFSQLATVPSNSTQYTHNNLSDELYIYQIKAANGCASSNFTTETEGSLILDFKAFGPTEWEFPVYDLSNFTYDQSHFDLTGIHKILEWYDFSGNGNNVIFQESLIRTTLISNPSNGSDSGLPFPRPILGRGPSAVSGALATLSNKSISNFLHLGNESYTLFFEFISTSTLSEIAGNLTFSGTGNYRQNGIELFFRNNYPVIPTKSIEVRMWNGNTSLVQIRTEVNSVIDEALNQVMITFDATTNTLSIFINDEAPVSAVVTDNFPSGESFMPFSLYGQAGNPASQLSGIGSSVCWRGAVLTQADFDYLRNTSSLYYQ